MEREQLAKEVTTEIEKARSLYRIHYWSNLIMSILIAAAGAATAFASQLDGESHWWASSTALLVYGLITAILTTLKEVAGSSTRAEHMQQRKRALQQIKIVLVSTDEAQFSYRQAASLVQMAKTDPSAALAELPPETDSSSPSTIDQR